MSSSTTLDSFPSSIVCTGRLLVGHIHGILTKKKSIESKPGTWVIQKILLNGDEAGYIVHHQDIKPSTLLSRVARAGNYPGHILPESNIKHIGRYDWGYESLESNEPYIRDQFRTFGSDYQEEDRLTHGGYFMLVDEPKLDTVVPALESLHGLQSSKIMIHEGTSFGINCHFYGGEYELAWIVNDNETNEMIGFIYDGSYSMFQGNEVDEYVVGNELTAITHPQVDFSVRSSEGCMVLNAFKT